MYYLFFLIVFPSKLQVKVNMHHVATLHKFVAEIASHG